MKNKRKKNKDKSRNPLILQGFSDLSLLYCMGTPLPPEVSSGEFRPRCCRPFWGTKIWRLQWIPTRMYFQTQNPARCRSWQACLINILCQFFVKAVLPVHLHSMTSYPKHRKIPVKPYKIPRPLHCCNERGILKGRISIQFIFGSFILWPFFSKIFTNFRKK